MSKIFDCPIKTFDPANLLKEMLSAESGTVFLLGEKRIKNNEGDDSVEVTIATIMKSKF